METLFMGEKLKTMPLQESWLNQQLQQLTLNYLRYKSQQVDVLE